MQLENAVVLRNEAQDGGYFLLEMKAPGVASKTEPGQFLHLRIPERKDMPLRRPFSIFKADEENVSLLYKVIGQGTDCMSRLRIGEEVNVLGPLGRGYPDPDAAKIPVLVAGAYGMAALYLVAERSDNKGLFLAGGRTADDLLCASVFEELGWQVRLATEDGSLGTKGLVTTILDEWLANEEGIPEFFACGPMGMLKAIGDRAIQGDWTSWLSLDHHMACGVGACLTCVHPIKCADGEVEKVCVCKEGPVFEGREIVWE